MKRPTPVLADCAGRGWVQHCLLLARWRRACLDGPMSGCDSRGLSPSLGIAPPDDRQEPVELIRAAGVAHNRMWAACFRRAA
jgi:hypothetical protein